MLALLQDQLEIGTNNGRSQAKYYFRELAIIRQNLIIRRRMGKLQFCEDASMSAHKDATAAIYRIAFRCDGIAFQ